MDAQSEAVLALVNPTLAALVRAAQDTLTPQNIFMSVYQGLRTADIMAPGSARVGTGVMGESILRELDKLAA